MGNEARRRRNARFAAALGLLAMAGCAQVLGFQELQADDGPDARSPTGDDAAAKPDASGPGRDAEAEASNDASGQDDRMGASDAEMAPPDAGTGPNECIGHCPFGCCTTAGQCVGASVAACGSGGSICADCTVTKQCTLGSPCCTLLGTCGCPGLGLGGCQ